jgi:hypothetical protein
MLTSKFKVGFSVYAVMKPSSESITPRSTSTLCRCVAMVSAPSWPSWNLISWA